MPLGIEQGSKAAQRLRINAISLGQLAHAACKVARLARIDHRHAQARSRQRQSQRLLVAASGLQQHQARRQRRQQLTQLGMAGLVVGEVQGLALARDSHFEAALGHVDADVNGFTHTSPMAPSLMNTKCVRSTIRDTTEQRDHHRAPWAEIRARARRRHRLHVGESTSSAIKADKQALTSEV